VPSIVPTPPSAPIGSLPPLGSPLGVSSCRPCLLVLEQGGPSEKASVVDLSSSLDEEGLIHDTLRDEEFARKLFGDLICDILMPPGVGDIINLSNSNEGEKVQEEDATDAEAAPSYTVRSPAPTAPTPHSMVLNETDQTLHAAGESVVDENKTTPSMSDYWKKLTITKVDHSAYHATD
jgi:hypothetical protein